MGDEVADHQAARLPWIVCQPADQVVSGIQRISCPLKRPPSAALCPCPYLVVVVVYTLGTPGPVGCHRRLCNLLGLLPRLASAAEGSWLAGGAATVQLQRPTFAVLFSCPPGSLPRSAAGVAIAAPVQSIAGFRLSLPAIVLVLWLLRGPPVLVRLYAAPAVFPCHTLQLLPVVPDHIQLPAAVRIGGLHHGSIPSTGGHPLFWAPPHLCFPPHLLAGLPLPVVFDPPLVAASPGP